MYELLRTYLPERVADILIVIWYLALIFMVIAYSTVDLEEFRYLNV